MVKLFRTYKSFMTAGIQDAITYRANFFGFFLGEIFYCFIMYFVWKAVFYASGQEVFMDTFNLNQMTVYLFITYITIFLTSTDSTYAIGEEIRDGSIVMRMIKPIQVNLSLLFFELGSKAITALCAFLPVLLGVEIFRFVAEGTVMFRAGNFLLYVISAMLSYLLSFYLNLAFGYLAFFLMNLWGLNILKNSIISFLSGAVIPLAFMPVWAKNILELLPFASLSYTPAMIYVGKYQGIQLVFYMSLQVFWVIFFYLLCKLIWKVAEKRLCVQGG